MANNWFKRITARLRKSVKPTEAKAERKEIDRAEVLEKSDKRYHVTIVDNVTGEWVTNEHTDAVLGTILRDRGPEYVVGMNTDIIDATSMVMKAEALCKRLRQLDHRINECESDILQRAKENKGKRFL